MFGTVTTIVPGVVAPGHALLRTTACGIIATISPGCRLNLPAIGQAAIRVLLRLGSSARSLELLSRNLRGACRLHLEGLFEEGICAILTAILPRKYREGVFARCEDGGDAEALLIDVEV